MLLGQVKVGRFPLPGMVGSFAPTSCSLAVGPGLSTRAFGFAPTCARKSNAR
jgi:hypothetical protein